MGPLRKRARTKPPSTEESDSFDLKSTKDNPSTTTVTLSSHAAVLSKGVVGTNSSIANPLKIPADSNGELAASSKDTQLKSKNSWYGTWPRKSVASTLVARETISADKVNSGRSNEEMTSRKSAAMMDGRPPLMFVGKSKETSDITKGDTSLAGPSMSIDESSQSKESPSASGGTEAASTNPVEVAPNRSKAQPDQDNTQRSPASSGWLGGWLGKAPDAEPSIFVADTPSNTRDIARLALSEQQTTQSESPHTLVPSETSIQSAPQPPSISWFGLWSTAAPPTAAKSTSELPQDGFPLKLKTSDTDTAIEGTQNLKSRCEQSPGSSWAFWTSDSTRRVENSTTDYRDSGQLAVVGEPSQDSPEPVKALSLKDPKINKPSKRGRPQSTELEESSNPLVVPESSSTKATPSQSPNPPKTSPPNLLVPSVRSTYRLMENPSILQQIARLILHGQQKPSKHVFLVKQTPKIKRALAIGIHGLFPAPLIRTVIGQPTGTSIRFANHGAAAIRRWCDQHGCVDCEIEKVALEGEGKIAERVDNLWKLLLNWIDHVRKADFILVSCHSQGVPVALMLVAKLIEFGVVSTGRIGVCAMAGVSLGPFADYKSRLFSGSAGELFEFAEPESTVAKRYEESLRVALKYGVRVTYCGSIDDQLVSMESSVFTTATHPHIYRAVFVDGRIHAPNFLSHLVGFALKLRNLGVSDHGLIRELSAPLAGSLYTGEGHSRLYDDEKVYDLSIEYALETTSVGDVPLHIKKHEISTNANPYVLPWIMRGLLEEDFVKTDLDTEVTELLEQFDAWKPATKVLKDVKYRLEAVRSML